MVGELARKLEAYPGWPDFPIIVLIGGGLSTAATEVAVRSRARLGNVNQQLHSLRWSGPVSTEQPAGSSPLARNERFLPTLPIVTCPSPTSSGSKPFSMYQNHSPRCRCR